MGRVGIDRCRLDIKRAKSANYSGDRGMGYVPCGPGIFGVRGQAKRDPALARSAQGSGTVKTRSPLRFAGKTELQVETCPCGQALQRSRVSPSLRPALYTCGTDWAAYPQRGIAAT